MASDYFADAGMVEALWTAGGEEQPSPVTVLATMTGRTAPQTIRILQDLADYDMVSPADDRWVLTGRGVAWATELASAAINARDHTPRSFKSFLDYRPTEWWPDGK